MFSRGLGKGAKLMKEYESNNTIREKAKIDSKYTKNTIFAFSNGKIFQVYNPLSAKHCIEDMNKAGAYLIGRFKDGYEV